MKSRERLFKKIRGTRKEAVLSSVRLENKYIAIQQLHKEQEFSIIGLCKIAEVSRAAYYKWINRSITESEAKNSSIIPKMIEIYNREGGIFGYRRLTMYLNRELKSNLNQKRIYRLMKLIGMQSVIRRKKKCYKKSNSQHIAENVLNRNFTAQMPNEKWLTDITEFKYGNKQKAYLSAILDLYDHSIVAYVLGTSNNC